MLDCDILYSLQDIFRTFLTSHDSNQPQSISLKADLQSSNQTKSIIFKPQTITLRSPSPGPPQHCGRHSNSLNLLWRQARSHIVFVFLSRYSVSLRSNPANQNAQSLADSTDELLTLSRELGDNIGRLQRTLEEGFAEIEKEIKEMRIGRLGN